MIAVIFEVEPAPGQRDTYLNLAARLKPLLEQVDGFISVERFQSITNPDKMLSLSRPSRPGATWSSTAAPSTPAATTHLPTIGCASPM